ncbi:hypothetical protein [Nostocoides vanveenii]|uniref:Type III restriction system methylase n=1 Tax=Nostocoides vanveenii TaxID=330835 RepID=A0ABP4WFQ0_9MICO
MSSRAHTLGEVFTADREVTAMLDLIPGITSDLDATLLEPSCGTGNFLVEALRRKLAPHVPTGEYTVLRALASLSGIDIDRSNVETTRTRMLETAQAAIRGGNPSHAFLRAADAILSSQIVCGDFLAPHQVVLARHSPGPKQAFTRSWWRLTDTAPYAIDPPVSYRDLAVL